MVRPFTKSRLRMQAEKLGLGPESPLAKAIEYLKKHSVQLSPIYILDIGTGEGTLFGRVVKHLEDSLQNEVPEPLKNQKKIDGGQPQRLLASSVCPVCIDMDQDLLALVPRQLQPVLSDAAYLPFKNETFHVITSSLFFIWASEWDRILYEIARVLKTGGVFVSIAEPDYSRYQSSDPFWAYDIVRLISQQKGNPKAGSVLSQFIEKKFLGKEHFSLEDDVSNRRLRKYSLEYGSYMAVQTYSDAPEEDWRMREEDLCALGYSSTEIEKRKELFFTLLNKDRWKEIYPIHWCIVVKHY